ncbi:methyl-accepting chemotaxis protein [Sulfurimonas sp.]|uniref:methyl-accepting chemotaxis protein n=1 Tax=Sulfurimonas sp. TaxID=2022749 RepID=UPI00262E932B|nr:methyl-accepting chemotaxis protein [Sulfurimonas sp.]
MSLMKKLSFAFGSILVLFLVVFIVVLNGLKDIQSSKIVLNNQDVLKEYVFKLKIHERGYLLRETKVYEDATRKEIKKIHTHIENTDGTLEEDIGMPKDLELFKESFDKYAKLVNQSKKIIEQNRLNINKVREASKQLRKDALKDLKKSRGNLKERLSTLEDQIVLIDYVTQIKIKEVQYLLFKKQSRYSSILTLLAKLKKHIEDSPGNLEEDAGIPNFLNAYKNGIVQLHSIYTKEKEYQHSMRKSSEGLMFKSKMLFKQANENTKHIVNVIETTTFIMAIISVIFVIVILFVIRKYIVFPVNNLNEKIKELSSSNGDLTHRIEMNSNDEIGDIAKNINKFMGKLEEMVSNLKHSASIAQDVTKEIETDAQLTSESVKSQNEDIANIKKYIDNISGDLDVSENSVRTTSEDVKETQQVLNNLVVSLQDVVDAINADSESKTEIVSKVTSLSDQTTQIKEIISIIKDIADQTNLLALNAAIEAARAGEHGRGFAVVADEVRKLAERTQTSVSEIDNFIKMIVEGVDDAKIEIERASLKSQEISESTNDLAQKANETKNKLNDTIKISETATRETLKINANVRDFMHSSMNLTKESEITNKVAADLIDVSVKLKEVNHEINEEINKFKV